LPKLKVKTLPTHPPYSISLMNVQCTIKLELPPPIYLDDSIPFAPAVDLDVEIPADVIERIDDFIDDGITIVPDIANNKYRGV
jgi:hypothetical protein